MAGFMQSDPNSFWGGCYVRFVVRTVGVTLTVTYTLWFIAIFSDEPVTYAATDRWAVVFRYVGLFVALAIPGILLLGRAVAARSEQGQAQMSR